MRLYILNSVVFGMDILNTNTNFFAIFRRIFDTAVVKHVNVTDEINCGFEAIKTIKVERNKFDRLVREALEIQYHQSGPSEGNINQDDGRYVKTKFWIPMLRNLQKKEGSEAQIRERRRHRREQTQINSSIHLTSDLASDEVIPTQVGS